MAARPIDPAAGRDEKVRFGAARDVQSASLQTGRPLEPTAKVGVFEIPFRRFGEFFCWFPIPSDSAACVGIGLAAGGFDLRPFADFASQMELEMERGSISAGRVTKASAVTRPY
jgi:hypothetical protein